MKILYIGDTSHASTSRHRADALTRLGHDVILADPYAALATQLRGKFSGILHYRTGYRLLQGAVRTWVDGLLRQHAGWPQLVWVSGGELIGSLAAYKLRQFAAPLILYNSDDPTGGRDGRRFDSLLAALNAYDLCAVLRQPNVDEFLARGARAVHRVWMSYDEIQHRPFDNIGDIPAAFCSDVAFVGTWMRGEGRDEFLVSLINHGLDIAIWGNRWQKSPNWKKLQSHWRGKGLAGRDYVAALQGAKLALGFVSHGNRDLHTRRSVEIPYAGGVLCAERTSEHLELFENGVEAVFWSNVDDCARVCRHLLDEDALREGVRAAGMARIRASLLGNEHICRQVIESVTASP